MSCVTCDCQTVWNGTVVHCQNWHHFPMHHELDLWWLFICLDSTDYTLYQQFPNCKTTDNQCIPEYCIISNCLSPPVMHVSKIHFCFVRSTGDVWLTIFCQFSPILVPRSDTTAKFSMTTGNRPCDTWQSDFSSLSGPLHDMWQTKSLKWYSTGNLLIIRSDQHLFMDHLTSWTSCCSIDLDCPNQDNAGLTYSTMNISEAARHSAKDSSQVIHFLFHFHYLFYLPAKWWLYYCTILVNSAWCDIHVLCHHFDKWGGDAWPKSKICEIQCHEAVQPLILVWLLH